MTPAEHIVPDDRLDRLTRPIIGIENRTPQEAFDIMCDRIRGALTELQHRRAEEAGTADYPPLVELGRVLGFFASVIKSGEPWTETCQREYEAANSALQAIYAASPVEATQEDIERTSRLAVERMAGAMAKKGFIDPAWLDGYWAACNLFAGNREGHDKLRDAFLESRK